MCPAAEAGGDHAAGAASALACGRGHPEDASVFHTHRETTLKYPELGVEVRRSTLNTPRRRRARTGYKTPIIEAAEGLFVMRAKAGEHILDYRYINGIRREGEEVEWLPRTTLYDRGTLPAA